MHLPSHMTSLYSVVLFDLDGTLFDSAVDIARACNDVVSKHGYKPLAFENVCPLIGHGSRGIIAHIIGQPQASTTVLNLRDEVLVLYSQQGYPNTRIFSPLLSVIEKINTSDVRWGVVTSKPKRHSQELLQKSTHTNQYAALVTFDDVTEIKPSPEGLQQALRQLDILPNQCLYVGDNRVDILAAQRAGIDCVGVGYGYCSMYDHPSHYDPDYYAHTPQDLANILCCLLHL